MYSPILELIPLNLLTLSPTENTIINEQIQRVSNLTMTDFQNYKISIDTLSNSLSQYYGLQDSDGNEVLGQQDITQVRNYTTDDLMQISILHDMSNALDQIIYNLKQKQKISVNLLRTLELRMI